MISFVRDENVLKTISLSSLDPLSLETYENITKIQDIYLCMLICEKSLQIYLLEDIIKMRYEIEYNAIYVYLLKDPVCREVVKDIYFFEKKLYKEKKKIVFENDDILSDEVSNSSIIFEYICNEAEMFDSKNLKKKLLNFEERKGSQKLIIFFIILIGIIFIIK